MKKEFKVVSTILQIILVVIVFQVGIAFATQTIPNPGHSWAQMESGPASINVVGRMVTNLTTPTNGTDAANKAYVDSKVTSYSASACTTVTCAIISGRTCTAVCPANFYVVGGGGVDINGTGAPGYPSGGGWACADPTVNPSGTCYAICCP